MATKIKSFENVRQYLNTVPNIDEGGCGIAALAMARWLKKGNWRHKVMFFMGYHNSTDFMNNTKSVYSAQNMNEMIPVPIAPSHAGIVTQTDGSQSVNVVDANGKLDLLRFFYTHTFYNEKIMITAVNNIGSWNTNFKRVNVKDIAKTLDIDLSDIDLRTKRQFKKNEKKIFYRQRKKKVA